jgi:hypothetical protein
MIKQNVKYVIITLSDYTNEQLEELVSNAIERNVNTLRKSIDGTLTFLKFRGSPSIFDGMTTCNNSQILTILKGSDWTSDEGE